MSDDQGLNLSFPTGTSVKEKARRANKVWYDLKGKYAVGVTGRDWRAVYREMTRQDPNGYWVWDDAIVDWVHPRVSTP